MTTPAAAPPPVDSSNADEVIAALGALLVAGATVAAVTTLLGTLKGVTKTAVTTLFKDRKLSKLLGKKLTDPGQKAATSARIRYVAAQQQAYARAAYMARATMRLAPAYATGDAAVIRAAQQREDTYVVAHAKAAAERQAAVNQLIKVAGKRKPDADGRILLGWYAEQFPCPICLAADGLDFDALDPPAIGWPGWVHPHCGCHAGSPHGNGMVDDVIKPTRSEVPAEIREIWLAGWSLMNPEQRTSGLQATKNGRKLWNWLTSAAGTAHFAGSPHPWTALVAFLVSKGVPPGKAHGEATNIMMATPAGRALFAKGHKGKGKKRSDDMKIETRTAEIVEVRGPGTAKPDARPGFTAKLVSYGVPDTYRTSWQQGVFASALETRSAAGASIPVVWDHNWADPVGQVVAYRDEKDGFYGDVEFDDFDAVPRAKQAFAQMQPNPTTGKPTMGQFSFAFVRGEETEDTEHRGVMRQTSVQAVQEFSIVLNGSVPGTRVEQTRGGKVDAATATELLRRLGSGETDLTSALVELRSATRTTAPDTPLYEIRATDPDAGDAGDDPMTILSAVDQAMSDAAAQFDAEDVNEAKRFFDAAYSRLAQFQYLVGMVPSAAMSGDTNTLGNRPATGYYAASQGEQRTEEPDEVLTALDRVGGAHW